MRRARRYILRVRPDGRIRLTIPRGGSKAEGLRFLESHRSWIEREQSRVAAVHAARAWTNGTMVALRGEQVPLVIVRTPVAAVVTYGGRTIPAPRDVEDARALVERDLRAVANQELPRRVAELAAANGLQARRVTIRNQRSRWGSCSRGGNIALNFRLVQMPVAVCDYIIVHELMHLREQNHSRRFWRYVEAAFPAFREAERWLKMEGRRLF